MADYNSRKMISRGGEATTYNEEEIVRATATSPHSNTNRHRPVVRSSTGGGNSGGGPRLPQKRYPSSSSPTKRADSHSYLPSIDRRSPTTSRRPERSDSGLGLDVTDSKQPVVTQTRRYLARGCTDSDEEDVIETDRGTTIVSHHSKSEPSLQQQPTNICPIYSSKSEPTYNNTISTHELMDTTIPPAKFNPQLYQRHLVELQQRAIEQDRLQQGLLLLLPNNDGDT